MEVADGLEQLFFTTCLVNGTGVAEGGRLSWSGTAFAYAVSALATSGSPGDPANVPFLISNRHVFAPDGAEDVELTFTFVKKHAGIDQPQYGQRFTGTARLDDLEWAAHPDPNVDVAAIGLGQLLNALSDEYRPFFRSVPAQMLISDEQIADLLPFEDLVFVGYPTGIYDVTNVVPVVRRGMTATPISLDYEGLPAFLLDGSVWPGSSGSPVLIAGQGTFATRGGGVVAGGRAHLVGVLAAVHVLKDVLPILPVSREGALLEQPIGLGVVFKARVINDVVDEMLGRWSARRVPA